MKKWRSYTWNGKAAQSVALAGSRLSPQAKGTKEERVVYMCYPWRSPSPEPSSLVDFPHHVSQPGVCGSNFPIDRTLPSLGGSSGVLSSLENLLLPVLVYELERLGPTHCPYSAPKKSWGTSGPKQRIPGKRAEDRGLLSKAPETQEVEISTPPSRFQIAPGQLSTNQWTHKSLLRYHYVTLVLPDSKSVRWVLLYKPILQMGKSKL